MLKSCLECKKEFSKPIFCSKADWILRKFCSKTCTDNFKTGKPSVSPLTTFKKGNKLWVNDYRQKRYGAENNRWRGGITPIHEKERRSPAYKNWRINVFKRDNFTCQICMRRGGDVHADHIKPFSLYPELRLNLDNGRTLCVPCHRNTSTYGNRILVLTTS